MRCNVNGGTVNVNGSYTITTTSENTSTTVDLQTAVGSPEPNQCTILSLKVHTTLAL
jgi:hypothetical protein